MLRDEVLALLDRHRPADPVEESHLRAVRAMVCDSAHPFRRDQFEPGHLTASAFVLNPDRSRVLLVHHASLDLWIQPGGHLEPHDVSLLAAAEREIYEECGLTHLEPLPGLLDVDVHDIPARPARGEPAHRHYDVRFALVSPTERFQVGDGVLAASWVPLDGGFAVRSDQSVRRALHRLRGERA